MTTVAKVSAFVLGALLYFVEELFLGYLAATTVPKAYFDFFGTHKVFALILEEAALVAFPAFLLALGWGLAATKLLRMSPCRVAGCVFAGLVIAWFGRQLQSAIDLQADPLLGGYPLSDLLLSYLHPPISALLTMASAPLGVLAASLIAQRRNRSSSPPLHSV